MNSQGTGFVCYICNEPIMEGEPQSWARRGDKSRYHIACKRNERESVANRAPIASGSDALGAMLAATVQPYLTIQRDEITAEMEEYVSERLADAFANQPKELKTVYIQSGQTIGTIDGHKHENFDLVATLVAMRKNIFLFGEAGSGKSTAAEKIADMLGLPFYYLGMQAQMTKSELMGYCDANGDYVATDFYRAYSQGGIYLIDEITLASGNLLGSLNGALANGRASFPISKDGSQGGQTKRHPDFICIATDNTPGLGATVQFSDCKALNGAVRDRFHFVQWDTDETLERQLASQHFDQSDAWVSWVRDVRHSSKTAHPKLTATQRASIEGSQLLAAGMDALAVANMLVFRGFEAMAVHSILASHPLPTFAN